MDYLEIKNDINFHKVVAQVGLDRILIGSISRYVAEAIENALLSELIEDDAIYGGKMIMDVCQDNLLSIKYFKETFLPSELQAIKNEDLGRVRLIATHGDCPLCGFDLESDQDFLTCTNDTCNHILTYKEYGEL